MARLSHSLYALMTAAALTFSAPLQAQTSAQPQNNAVSCQAFANLGGIVADYILPMSLRDFAAMNAGQAPHKVQEFVAKIERELSANDRQAFSRLGQGNAELFEESATEFAINLVLDGHAPDRQTATSIMRQECTQATPQRIIDIQRQAYQSESQGQ